ncbi:MAG: HlyD family efflux transporter periplasmic adaptor subunit [Lachnospiraceae bacterium]|nr:HlyD family efflux transporter periplasmic adaptor subunit [Lachnospiraceae bacterium]
MKKIKITKKFVIIAGIAAIAAAAGIAAFLTPKETYMEEAAQKIDLVSKLEFAGDVEANETKAIYSVVNQVKVVDVNVKEGDYVEEGDVLVELDKTNIKYDIKAKELELEQARIDKENNLTDQQTELNELKTEVAGGLNPDILAKQSALHNAQSEYDTLVYKWNKSVMDYENGMNQDLVNAQNALHAAQVDYYQSERNGQASIASAELEKKNKKKRYERLDDESCIVGSGVTDGDVEDAKSSYKEAKKDLEKTKTSVETELGAKAAAVESAQNVLTAVDNSIREQNNEFYVLDFIKVSAALADAQADLAATSLSVEQQKDSIERKIEAQTESTTVSQAEVNLEHLQSDYDNYTIKAPCSGYISGLDVKVGDTVDSKVLMNILNYDEMKVVIDVDEYDMGRFMLDTPVQIKINSLDKTYDGVVTGIAAKAEKKNDLSFIKITATFKPDERISAGIGATVYTVEDEDSAQICVPSAAVTINEETGDSEVTIVDGSFTRQQIVETGDEKDGYIAILSGVKEGEIVRYDSSAAVADSDEMGEE